MIILDHSHNECNKNMRGTGGDRGRVFDTSNFNKFIETA